jgi:hypothetical protein
MLPLHLVGLDAFACAKETMQSMIVSWQNELEENVQ